MEAVKSNFIKGMWVIPNLITPVKEKMLHSLKIQSKQSELSTTYLSSNLYKPGKANSQLHPMKCHFLKTLTANSVEAPYLNQIIDQLFINNSGYLIDSDKLRPETISWISGFQMFCEKNLTYNCLISFLEYAFMLDGVKFRGASHPHFLSSLFLQLKPTDTKFDFFVSIIHESAHQELFLLNFIDRLVNIKYDLNLIHAPYQNKVRPPIGRLHSLHALYRMIQFSLVYESENSKVDFFISKFKENLNSFEPGELTEFATFIFEEVYGSFSKTL